jgi:EAL domain-containing protein (putative c-di-GMP-specific phosphodiesterase class I)
VGLDRFTGDTGMVAALFDLPIDFVKIDGSIVSALQTSTRARTRVQVIAKLAGGNRVRTIAEHVEAPETLDIVRSLGVDAVQGYGVAMPEPFE